MKDTITFTYNKDNIYKHLEQFDEQDPTKLAEIQFALSMVLRMQHVNVEKLSKDINKMSKRYIKKLNARGHNF